MFFVLRHPLVSLFPRRLCIQNPVFPRYLFQMGNASPKIQCFSCFRTTAFQIVVIFFQLLNFDVAFSRYLYYNQFCKNNLPFINFFTINNPYYYLYSLERSVAPLPVFLLQYSEPCKISRRTVSHARMNEQFFLKIWREATSRCSAAESDVALNIAKEKVCISRLSSFFPVLYI